MVWPTFRERDFLAAAIPQTLQNGTPISSVVLAGSDTTLWRSRLGHSKLGLEIVEALRNRGPAETGIPHEFEYIMTDMAPA